MIIPQRRSLGTPSGQELFPGVFLNPFSFLFGSSSLIYFRGIMEYWFYSHIAAFHRLFFPIDLFKQKESPLILLHSVTYIGF